MKIAVLCDLHLPLLTSAAQYAILDWAVENIVSERTDLTVTVGDTSAGGDVEALEYYLDRLREHNHMFLLGNSDIRDQQSAEEIISKYAGSRSIETHGYRILGISTPFAWLTEQDKELLKTAEDGNIVCMHHDFSSLNEESKAFFAEVLGQKALTVIHGHKHKEMEAFIGKSKLIGLTGQDPDKAMGGPRIAYFELTETGYTKYDRVFEIDRAWCRDVLGQIGISCFDPENDIDYATRNGIRNIEIQLRNERDLEHYPIIREKVSVWRERGGRYLSCHLPELRLTDGVIQGIERWYRAIEIVLALNPDGVTVHVPRASVKDMLVDGAYWRQYLGHYIKGLKKLSGKTKIGIENLHMIKQHKANNGERLFGVNPEECLMWIDALNVYLGENRVGAVLDVGHATNNSVFRSRYTRSMWYEIVGKRTVAYHVHQVINVPGEGLKNHYEISDWLGMTISYASFFWAWGKKRINHAPVFLEMRTLEMCDVSISVLKALDI